MRSTIITLTFLLSFFCFQTAKSQFYEIGQERTSTRWRSIETRDFKIIYPDYLERTARESASFFQQNAANVQSGLRARPAQTPIILHPSFANSNAYAIWAPQRIEVLTTPGQDTYGDPWLHQLALHEYRHMVQLVKLEQGITKGLSYIFGQQAVAVSTGLFVPSWFLEGDAVVTETEFSETGRGRVAAFSNPFRAQLAEKGAYSYPKAAFGSYRDFVPNVYTLGYHIVSYGREKYGNELWNSALDAVARKPFTITPFNYGIKKISGTNKKGLYKETVANLDLLWGGKQTGDANYIKSVAKSDDYINYLNPFLINDTTIVALKTSFSKRQQIIEIKPSGDEKILLTTGYIPDNLISCNKGWLAWAEYRPHVRWQTVSYTDVVLYNPVSGEKHRKLYRRRFYSPVSTEKGDGFAAIEYTPEGKAFITTITGIEEQKAEVPEGIHPITPVWAEEGKSLIFIAMDEAGKGFMKFDISHASFSRIGEATYTEISDPSVAGEWLYFTGTSGNKNQLCRMSLNGGPTEIITSSAYGAVRPHINLETIVYSDYTSDGYRIATKPLKSLGRQLYVPDIAQDWIRVAELKKQENPSSDIQLQDSSLVSNEYRKASHLFNIHSWAPLYVDIAGETARPGFSVMSQNLLSTLFVTAGYDYDLNEQTGMFRTKVTYKGLFPEISSEISTGNRAASRIENGSAQRFTWRETNVDLSIGQSLNFSSGKYNRGVYGQTSHTLTQISHNNDTPDNFTKGSLSVFSYRLFAYTYSRQAYRDLAPRMGINAELTFRHSPFGSLDAGNIQAIQTQVFLPGFFANHSFGLYAGYQFTHARDYRFQNIIATSRGYNLTNPGNEIKSCRVNYKLPLWYPDLHLGGLLYFKRLRTNIFHDYTKISADLPEQIYHSSGLNLIADLHLLGLSMPVSAGIRGIYLHNQDKGIFEILFSINFYEY